MFSELYGYKNLLNSLSESVNNYCSSSGVFSLHLWVVDASNDLRVSGENCHRIQSDRQACPTTISKFTSRTSTIALYHGLTSESHQSVGSCCRMFRRHVPIYMCEGGNLHMSWGNYAMMEFVHFEITLK